MWWTVRSSRPARALRRQPPLSLSYACSATTAPTAYRLITISTSPMQRIRVDFIELPHLGQAPSVTPRRRGFGPGEPSYHPRLWQVAWRAGRGDNGVDCLRGAPDLVSEDRGMTPSRFAIMFVTAAAAIVR